MCHKLDFWRVRPVEKTTLRGEIISPHASTGGTLCAPRVQIQRQPGGIRATTMAERATGLGLVNRRGVAAKEKFGTIVEDAPNINISGSGAGSTPTSSGDGSVANGEPGTFGYKIQEFDSASSLGPSPTRSRSSSRRRGRRRRPHIAPWVRVASFPSPPSTTRRQIWRPRPSHLAQTRPRPRPRAHLPSFPPQLATRRLAVLGVHRGAVAAPARVVLPPLWSVLCVAGAPRRLVRRRTARSGGSTRRRLAWSS